jgi:synaptobrevin family protein YKT6
MTILSISIGKISDNIIYDIHYQLENFNFLQKKKIKEVCLFTSRLGLKQIIENNKLTVINYDKYYLYCYNDQIACCIISDSEINMRVINKILKKIINDTKLEIDINSLKKEDFSIKIKSIQNISANEIDKIEQIKEDLEETKQIMIQNIEDVIARGESLDELVDATYDLSNTSKMFYKTSKKLNRGCCVIS